jgi:hypothetical protein
MGAFSPLVAEGLSVGGNPGEQAEREMFLNILEDMGKLML